MKKNIGIVVLLYDKEKLFENVLYLCIYYDFDGEKNY